MLCDERLVDTSRSIIEDRGNNMIEGHYFGMHFLWWIIWIIILISIFALPYGGLGSNPKEADAINVLKERFAKGEIDKDEYEEKLKTLKSD